MRKILGLSILWVIFASNNIIADEQVRFQNQFNNCVVSKKAINDYEPKQFNNTNNALRAVGKVPHFDGEPIIIKGVIRGKDCKPLANVKIQLWQANSRGKYPYQPLKSAVNKGLIEISDNDSFTGSAEAYSNNFGEFTLLSVYPDVTDNEYPFIMLRAGGSYLNGFQTKFYLEQPDDMNAYFSMKYDEDKLKMDKDIPVITPNSAQEYYINIIAG